MKKITILLIALTCCFAIQAQEKETKNKFDVNKLEIGGYFGMSFGNSSSSGDSYSINIMPQVGYRFSSMFSVGAGIGYIYRSWNDYSENYAGASIYGRFRPIRYLSLRAEPQVFRFWGSHSDSRTVPCLLLGAGAIVPMGSNLGMSATISYDVIRDDYSPYHNGWVYSIGFVYGF